MLRKVSVVSSALVCVSFLALKRRRYPVASGEVEARKVDPSSTWNVDLVHVYLETDMGLHFAQ